MGRIFAFLFIISLIALIISRVAWRRTRKKTATSNKAHDLDFVCAPHSTVVNNVGEVDEATELHIVCCAYCLLELEKNPARLDVMSMPQATREFLISVITATDSDDEPNEPAS